MLEKSVKKQVKPLKSRCIEKDSNTILQSESQPIQTHLPSHYQTKFLGGTDHQHDFSHSTSQVLAVSSEQQLFEP